MWLACFETICMVLHAYLGFDFNLILNAKFGQAVLTPFRQCVMPLTISSIILIVPVTAKRVFSRLPHQRQFYPVKRSSIRTPHVLGIYMHISTTLCNGVQINRIKQTWLSFVIKRPELNLSFITVLLVLIFINLTVSQSINATIFVWKSSRNTYNKSAMNNRMIIG